MLQLPVSKPRIFNLGQVYQFIYFCCCGAMKFLNTPFVALQDQSVSHMPTSNRLGVQNQQTTDKFKFSVKGVYASEMLALEIMSKKSVVEQYSLCKSKGKKNYSSVIGENADAQLL